MTESPAGQPDPPPPPEAATPIPLWPAATGYAPYAGYPPPGYAPGWGYQPLPLRPPPALTWSHPGYLMALAGVALELLVVTGLVLLAVGYWRPGLALGEVLACLVPAVIFIRVARVPRGGVLRMSGRAAAGLVVVPLIAFGLWLANNAALNWLVEALDQTESVRHQAERILGCHSVWDWVWTIVGLSVAAPLGEEILYRGLIQRGLEERWSPWAAILLTAVIFAATHLQLLSFLMLFLLGVEFGWLYYRSRSLWPSIVAHAVNNLAAVVLFNVADEHPWLEETLAGGLGYFLVAQAVVMLVVFALIVGRVRRRSAGGEATT